MGDIEKRIAFSFGALNLAFLAMAIITLIEINAVTASSRKIQYELQPSIQANLQLTNAINSSISGLQSWVLTQKPRFIRKRAAFISIIDKSLKQLINQSQNWQDPLLLEELQRLEPKLALFKEQQNVIENMVKEGQQELAIETLVDVHLPLSYEIVASLRKISDPHSWEIARTFQQEEQNESFLKNVILLFLFLSIAGGISLAILLNRAVLAPLKNTIQLADRIGKGDYSSTSTIYSGEEKLDKVLQIMLEQLEQKQQLNIAQQSELKKINLSLKYSNEELSQFAYRTSHDLKAPLVAVRGLAEIIKEDLNDGIIDEAKHNATRISRQVKKLESLVSDILELTKADQETQSLDDVDVTELTNDIIIRLNTVYFDKQISINTSIPNNFRMLTSRVRLNQILENLISNAIKYRDKEKKLPSVSIRFIQQNGGYIIEVEDNGVGIPEAYQEQVFGMFQRFHPDNAAGSGLGLYIVKKHVNKLGGEISFISSEAGTTFRIEIQD